MRTRWGLLLALAVAIVLSLSAFAKFDRVTADAVVSPDVPIEGRVGGAHRAPAARSDSVTVLVASSGVDPVSKAASKHDETEDAGELVVLAPTTDEGTPRVAVTEFDDHSGARLANMGAGVADKLAARLAASGVRIVDRGEIEALMQIQGLNPTSLGDLSHTARQLGVGFLVTGTVENVAVDTATLDLGIVRVTSAEAHATATASLVDAVADEVTAAASASGNGKGTTELSLYLGDLLSPSSSTDACSGGLRSEREAYADGELASFGYSNSSTSGWFGLEVYTSDGTFLRWLGWRFVARDACETWFWDQRDALGAMTGAGLYVARLRDGDIEVDAVAFQIRPGLTLTLPSLDRLTVGSEAFDDDIVGAAVDDMVAQLAAALLPSIFAQEASPAGAPFSAAETVRAGEASSLLGQVAGVLPDGRITINVGSSHGVAAGDRFEVLDADDLAFDPETLSVVAYEVLATKGEICIVEVRERASDGVREGDFEPLVGDLVRFLP